MSGQVYTTEALVRGVLSSDGVDERLDDDGDGTVSADELTRLTDAIRWASSEVRRYCVPRYDEDALVGDVGVEWWATLLAAHNLCMRRGNPPPAALQAQVYGDGSANNGGVMGGLRDVKAERLNLSDIPTRNPEWPTWSSSHIDHRYRLQKARIERPLSERTPVSYPRAVDRDADFLQEPW